MSKTFKYLINETTVVYKTTHYYGMKIDDSKIGAAFFRDLFHPTIETVESFYAIYLNRAHNVKNIQLVGKGGMHGVIVDPIIIVKAAIDCLASYVIITHNHPSDNVLPSDNDKSITNRINNALNLFNVKVLDHIIITEKDHFSFADQGLL